MIAWTTAAPAVAAAFLASLVEFVEAFTILLAVGAVRGWRPALLGALAGAGALVLLVAAFGPALAAAPLAGLQIAIGALLLLFGLRWLRKAILRAAGILPRRDETRTYAAQSDALRRGAPGGASRFDWLAAAAAGKAVLVEGLEVVFIVLAVGAGRGLLVPACLGALAAGALALGLGLILRKPLARIPENALKFCVGVLLSAFGVFWTGEGLGVAWPGADLAIPALIGLFLAVALGLVAALRPRLVKVAS